VLSVARLDVMLSVIMLIVGRQDAVMLGVVAPR
jgi:hypothetical protein